MKKTFINPENALKTIGVNDGMFIADFGCGAGAWTIPVAFLAGKDGKVYAIDILDHMLEVTGNKAKKYNFQNIELLKRDIEKPIEESKLKIKEKSCDLVIISNILFQLKEKNNVFENAKKLIKKEGKILVIDWLENSLLGPDKKLRVKKEDIEKIIKDKNLIIEKEIDAGHFHYGLLLKLKD